MLEYSIPNLAIFPRIPRLWDPSISLTGICESERVATSGYLAPDTAHKTLSNPEAWGRIWAGVEADSKICFHPLQISPQILWHDLKCPLQMVQTVCPAERVESVHAPNAAVRVPTLSVLTELGRSVLGEACHAEGLLGRGKARQTPRDRHGSVTERFGSAERVVNPMGRIFQDMPRLK